MNGIESPLPPFYPPPGFNLENVKNGGFFSWAFWNTLYAIATPVKTTFYVGSLAWNKLSKKPVSSRNVKPERLDLQINPGPARQDQIQTRQVRDVSNRKLRSQQPWQKKKIEQAGLDHQLEPPLKKRRIHTADHDQQNRLTIIQNAVARLDAPLRSNFKKKMDRLQKELSRVENSESSRAVLQEVVRSLIHDCVYPGNLSVLQVLADEGVGVVKELGFYKFDPRVPPLLLRQVLDNSDDEAVMAFLDINAVRMIYMADSTSTQTVEKYLTHAEIKEAVHSFNNNPEFYNSYFPLSNNPNLLFSQCAAHYLITGLFAVLGNTLSDSRTEQDISQSIITDLNSERFIANLYQLEVNASRYQQLIKEELQHMDAAQRERLFLCAFILGQKQMFGLLKETLVDSWQAILNQRFNQGANILHVLATALPDYCEGVHFTFLNRYGVAYDDLFQLLPARDLANMKDDSGATPLMRLYHQHPYQVSDLPLISPDQNLVRSRRSSLLKLTSGESLIDCIQSLIAFGHPLSVTWFSEYLYLFKHLYYQRPSLTFTPTAFPSASPLPERCEEANFHHTLESTNHFFQRVISFLASNTDIFWNFQAGLELTRLVQRSELPIEYLAQVIRVMVPDMQYFLLAYLTKTRADRKSMFIKRGSADTPDESYYPWHLIGLALGADSIPAPRACSAAFLCVVEKFAARHTEKNIPRLPEPWEKPFFANSHITVYGRSLAFPCAATPNGYRRYKFLKQLPGGREPWGDFIREQPHLEFFRRHKAELGLESALLKPMGIFRLTDALSKLQRAGVPESTLAMIAFEPDNSAFLQVFDDEENSALYHHYPYETEGVDGLGVEASLAGLGLFARDAGRLWRENLQAPDALSMFHDTVEGRAWSPTPFFSKQRCPGNMGQWRQDYPNIAPAPVGMRDWADIRSFNEHTIDLFVTRCHVDVTSAESQQLLRISELGKTFYGLAINWLRVRHDTGQLDYTNSEQMNQLAGELVAIAADLFGTAFGMQPEAMKEIIHQKLPAETLRRAALECGYWCDPDVRYVQDIRKKRFPRSVYPDYTHKDFIKMNLTPIPKNLTRKGIWRSSRAKSPNLGANSAPLPLVHLDSLFWFAILTGWRHHT
ncbi:hypothetical protein ACTL6P_16325 [Endozoicomonas acroporae]|uniref:hypothetical protein n=1 Tax=Endozoicomonas acroporae TaxID=1701104 RepID=UPI000C76AE9E|nr:hypothetical protein [Endozoicomonas acroporae]